MHAGVTGASGNEAESADSAVTAAAASADGTKDVPPTTGVIKTALLSCDSFIFLGYYKFAEAQFSVNSGTFSCPREFPIISAAKELHNPLGISA